VIHNGGKLSGRLSNQKRSLLEKGSQHFLERFGGEREGATLVTCRTERLLAKIMRVNPGKGMPRVPQNKQQC
jgi:hypothetical protein